MPCILEEGVFVAYGNSGCPVAQMYHTVPWGATLGKFPEFGQTPVGDKWFLVHSIDSAGARMWPRRTCCSRPPTRVH